MMPNGHKGGGLVRKKCAWTKNKRLERNQPSAGGKGSSQDSIKQLRKGTKLGASNWTKEHQLKKKKKKEKKKWGMSVEIA